MKEAPTKDQIFQELKKEFLHVYEWSDGPNIEYPKHSHKGKVSFYVVEGSIVMDVDGVRSTVKKGQRLDVPVGCPHTAKVGTEGCTFVVGEEIEGDS